MKQIAVLGSTGSIGTQTLEVVRANEDMQIVTLAAGSNIDLLEKADCRIYAEVSVRVFGRQGKRITGAFAFT